MKTIEVFSARPLSARDREKIEIAFSQKVGQQVRAEYAVDPSLIGGIRVICEDEIFDGTVSAELEKILQDLK